MKELTCVLFRVNKEYEEKEYFSKLYKFVENYLKKEDIQNLV